MDGYEASTYGDRIADVYDDWFGGLTDADACTARLTELAEAAGRGPVLELGVGSGRLALPLAARGIEVHGVDASQAMLERLRAKPGADALTLTHTDMADLALVDPPSFSVVFAAFNTIFNLGSADAQRRCFARVAQLLAPDGVLVLEAFVPGDAVGAGPFDVVTPRHIALDEVVLSVSRHDVAQQTITGQYVHVTEAGIRLRPWHLRYAHPEELDALAAEAGLELAWREGGWDRTPFGRDSGVHVSGYRRGNVRNVPSAASAPPR